LALRGQRFHKPAHIDRPPLPCRGGSCSTGDGSRGYDVAFRRPFELDAGRCHGDFVDIEAAGLFRRKLPQPRAEIGGLRHVADDALVAVGLFERSNKLLVVRIVQALAVLHAGERTGDIFDADAQDFVLGHRGCQQRLLAEINAGCLELLVERNVRSTHDDRVDHVRLHQLHLVDDRVELGGTEREVVLTDDFATGQVVFDMRLRAILLEVRGQM
jgi:hypothetical protein